MIEEMSSTSTEVEEFLQQNAKLKNKQRSKEGSSNRAKTHKKIQRANIKKAKIDLLPS